MTDPSHPSGGRVAVACENLFYPCRLTCLEDGKSNKAAVAASSVLEGQRQLMSAVKDIADAINTASDEAELDQDASKKAEHIHVFMAVPGALNINSAIVEDEQQKQELIRQMLCQLGERVDGMVCKRLHGKAVSEWEARVRVTVTTNAGVSSPFSSAWRIVVQNPSRHACSVQVRITFLCPKPQPLRVPSCPATFRAPCKH